MRRLVQITNKVHLLFTARVRSTTGGYIFNLFVCPPGRGGYLSPGWGEGYPSLWSKIPSQGERVPQSLVQVPLGKGIALQYRDPPSPGQDSVTPPLTPPPR